MYIYIYICIYIYIYIYIYNRQVTNSCHAQPILSIKLKKTCS